MLKVACFDFNLRVDIICRNSGTTDLSVGSTETKYIKLKTKTQNPKPKTILLFMEFFIKNDIIILAFFETI